MPISGVSWVEKFQETWLVLHIQEYPRVFGFGLSFKGYIWEFGCGMRVQQCQGTFWEKMDSFTSEPVCNSKDFSIIQECCCL